jgi:hypothetical protein
MIEKTFYGLVILFVVLLITLFISYIFERRKIINIWLTYIINLIIFALIFVRPVAIKALKEDVNFVYFFFGLITIFLIFQLLSNLILIGRYFLRNEINKKSTHILDDNFIK